MPNISDARRTQAWRSGVNAANAGKSRASCRWPHGTIYFDDWHDAYENQKRKETQRGDE